MSSKTTEQEDSEVRRRMRDDVRHYRDNFLAQWKRRGSLSFEEFMTSALYDEQFGYYPVQIQDIGHRGDFSTSATLGEDVGVALAGWIIEERKRLSQWWERIHIVEVGGGNGKLAESILGNLPFSVRWRVKYHIVEKSARLTGMQKARLKKYAGKFFSPVEWHQEIDSILAKVSRFIVISNELVDAFPVTVFRWNSNRMSEDSVGEWQKLFLELTPEGLFERFENVSKHELGNLSSISSPKAWAGGTIPHDQRCEVHFSYREWLHSWVPRAKQVSMVTIDYGGTMPELYMNRKNGTIRGYFNHQVMEGHEVYRNVGRQDITCDVNFSDLVHWGHELHLKCEPMLTQSEFLERYAPVDRSESYTSSMVRVESGAGTAFKVLIQRK
ncbi:MAG: SAM-dependent methyltransferase [Verrucomicrobia bacterium]|nr:SAM-dependent methyltransferase [Verrucomicrobiota bacterium]